MKIRAILLAIALVTGAAPLHASFHEWEITEIFTTLDGRTQFIEMYNFTDGEEFVAGHHLFSNLSDYVFATNTPPETANKYLFMATGPIAGIQPDFIIPSNFFRVTNDHVNFSGVTNLAWTTNMPTDGLHSLAKNGLILNATPTNFAGDTTTITTAVPEPGTGIIATAVALLAGIRLYSRRKSSAAQSRG